MTQKSKKMASAARACAHENTQQMDFVFNVRDERVDWCFDCERVV